MDNDNSDDQLLSRREWLHASATISAALAVSGCASVPAVGRSGVASAKPSRGPYDVVIIGGGPAGLSAALALGRARKRVLLCDSGPRRNAAAKGVHTFVTRDGIPPDEFRQIARAQLSAYPTVEVRDERVDAVSGTHGAFVVTVAGSTVEARRILIGTGMVDEMLPIEGFKELWGHALFQCPYCHGWEVQDRPWGYLARSAAHVSFALLLRGWTRELVVFTGGAFEVPEALKAQLVAAGVRLEAAPIRRLVRSGEALQAVELSTDARVPCEVLFVHPPQRQVKLVSELGLALDEHNFVKVNPMTKETSVPGIYAAGDLAERIQSAIIAAASGVHAAAMINHELTLERAVAGAL